MDSFFVENALPVRWQWASYTPTEGLNVPAGFLGVLRAMYKCEGLAPGSPEFLRELQRVEDETGTNVNLVRDSERNLLRNSRQYWLSKGLIEDEPGVIKLTPFGRKWANADCSAEDFVLEAIDKFSITTPYGNVRALNLILSVMMELPADSRFISPEEIFRIVAPLGLQSSVVVAKAVLGFRSNPAAYPLPFDPPGGTVRMQKRANDVRMAREPLLFLAEFGVLREGETGAERGKYFFVKGLDKLHLNFFALGTSGSSVIANVIRQTRLSLVTSRPEQARFRRDVFSASGGVCLITSEPLSAVLEAAHIRPFASNGPDVAENGLCLRSDIHQLFDSNLLRINEEGSIKILDEAMSSPSYSAINCRRILIPGYVNREHLRWRYRYV